ncbi:unnamed protein product [Orchesella dallaii]|uniref:Uncharacterized protein n=1 Tax=Orchesella dallaii TaxID=48710 RepID=A0ABP1RHW1_9HEXA
MMAPPNFQQTTQCNSSENHINTEINVSVPLHENETDSNVPFEILQEKYSVVVEILETLKTEFQALPTRRVPAIQYNEILKQNKDLLQTNEKVCKANEVLLKISKSGKEGRERAKVSPENLKVFRDIQKLNDELKKETKNSAKNLARLEKLDKLNKERLGKISLLFKNVEGHIGNVSDLEEKLFRLKAQHKIDIDIFKKKYDEVGPQILNLQFNLKLVYDKKEMLQQKIKNLKEQLKLNEADVIEAREKNEKLQEEQKNLEGTVAPERKQDEKILQSHYDDLQQQNQDQLNLIQSLEDRILAERSEIRRLEQEPLRVQNIELKKDLKGTNAEITQLKADMQQLKQTYATEIKNLNKKLNQANTNLQQSDEKNKILRQEVENLTNASLACKSQQNPVAAGTNSQPRNPPVLIDHRRDVIVDMQNQPRGYKRKRNENELAAKRMIRRALGMPHT